MHAIITSLGFYNISEGNTEIKAKVLNTEPGSSQTP
jgi:hypothetical protein